ncbi:uncharacterized protein LOC131850569 [Achroia grisella]|uniref:uncharacterized protein LOC131850569 n=1 Tax=Achroia grisella TaxID=688607 RepID=UPI0027D214AC|nr:uncharacterized protein LOC131850569 [Achroia grisella]
MKRFLNYLRTNPIKTVGERNEVDNTMNIILWTQVIFGLQILNPKWTWKTSLLQHFLNGCLSVYVAWGTYNFIKKTKDVQFIAEASFTLILVCTRIFKGYLFASKKNVFQKLYLIAKTYIFHLLKADSADRTALVMGKKAIHMFFTVLMIPVVFYSLIPMLYYFRGNRILVSNVTSILMPMSSPYYEIGSILHIMSIFQISFVILVVDLWFVILMLFYCMASDKIVKILEVENKGLDEDNKQYADRLNNSLKNFYEVHMNINEFLNIMSEMYRWLAVVPLYMVALCTCCILLLTSNKINLAFTSTAIPLLSEIFVFNWFGEQVKTKAENLNLALLHYDWISMHPKDIKCYHIILCYMNKTFSIKTAFGNELSLITLTSVLKATYQAFTVLRTLDNN